MLLKLGKEAYNLKFEKYFDLIDDTFSLNP